jgi:hypothetical protein
MSHLRRRVSQGVVPSRSTRRIVAGAKHEKGQVDADRRVQCRRDCGCCLDGHRDRQCSPTVSLRNRQYKHSGRHGRERWLPTTFLPAIWVSGALCVLPSSIWLLWASVRIRLPARNWPLSASGRQLCRRSTSGRQLRQRAASGRQLRRRSTSGRELRGRAASGKLLIELLEFGLAASLLLGPSGHSRLPFASQLST